MKSPSSVRKRMMNEFVAREEFDGRTRIPLGIIIYRAYNWTVRCLATAHIYPNYFVFSVIALEDAALPLLRKQGWWTPEEFQKQVELMSRYQIDPRMIRLHPSVRDARAKFRLLTLLLEPYLDPTSMVDYDLGGNPGSAESPGTEGMDGWIP